jgi:hypothetical protein
MQQTNVFQSKNFTTTRAIILQQQGLRRTMAARIMYVFAAVLLATLCSFKGTDHTRKSVSTNMERCEADGCRTLVARISYAQQEVIHPDGEPSWTVPPQFSEPITTMVIGADTSSPRGYFRFKNVKMSFILYHLGQWYGVKIIYTEPMADTILHFGPIARKEKITKPLDLLVLTGAMHYTYNEEEKAVYIRP